MVSKTAAATLVLCLTGCAASTQTVELPVENHRFTAPLHTPLSVTTGEDMFLEGAFAKGEQIAVGKPVDIMIPGPLLAPLTVHIDPTALRLSKVTAQWKYYCGPADRVRASSPSASSVLGTGDCVGMRVASNNPQTKEWVIDNSVYTDRSAIWSTPLLPGQGSTYQVSPSSDLHNVQRLQRLTFEGFYGRQLHFTWHTQNEAGTERKAFSFDFVGDPTSIAIEGMALTVSEVNDRSIVYQWTRLSTDAH